MLLWVTYCCGGFVRRGKLSMASRALALSICGTLELRVAPHMRKTWFELRCLTSRVPGSGSDMA